MLSVHIPVLDPPFAPPKHDDKGAICFSLNEGERLVIIGPNGSGKTSLLRMIAQELTPRAGRLLLDDQPLADYSRQARAQMIAVLAQHDDPDPRLTVKEYVTLGRLPHSRTDSAHARATLIDSVLNDNGLTALSAQPLGKLSGGERQRAALARALAQTPRLLLLDEPTNHLDLVGRAAFLDRVKQQGITVIAVLHDLALVASFADKVLLLSHGRQIVCDTPDQTLTTHHLEPVFGLTTTLVPHPRTGKPLRLFETPYCNR